MAILGMLRAIGGCRGLWQASERSIGIQGLIRQYTQSCEGVQEIQYEARETLQTLLSPACEASGPENEPPKLSTAVPCIINGAMTEANGWEAVSWNHDDLIAACNGEIMVPVEVSVNGGDYRDLYRAAQSSSRRQFEAGVPVPLSFLMEHVQQLSDEAEQVCLMILVAAGLSALPELITANEKWSGAVQMQLK